MSLLERGKYLGGVWGWGFIGGTGIRTCKEVVRKVSRKMKVVWVKRERKRTKTIGEKTHLDT